MKLPTTISIRLDGFVTPLQKSHLCAMSSKTVALIEFGGSHDECLLTQAEAIRSADWEIVLVVDPSIYARNPQLVALCRTVHLVQPTGKAFGDLKLMRNLVKTLKKEGVSKAVFNTAQGGHIRNLALLMPGSITCYGIIHTIRKFQGSFTQQVIHKAIRRYVVLSDDLLKRVRVPKGVTVGSFYPICYPQPNLEVEKSEGERWITITGGVENRRKDLSGLVEFIESAPPECRFIFLGKTDTKREDVQTLLQELGARKLTDHIRYYTHFVDHVTFDAVLRKTDLLLPLIHPGTPSADEYISNQISGAFTLSWAYHIPLLVHEAYRGEEDLAKSAFFYSQENAASVVRKAIDEREVVSARIAAEPKWQVEVQYRNYLELLEITIEEN